jgi:hypothetical protein
LGNALALYQRGIGDGKLDEALLTYMGKTYARLA